MPVAMGFLIGSGPRHPAGGGAASPREHQLVRLLADLPAPEGVIPAGTLGTVLQVFGGGAAYQVEFEGLFEAPETVPAELLEPVLGPA